MSTQTETQTPGTFGNIVKPGRSGLFGMSPILSLALVPVIIIAVLLMAKGWWAVALILTLVTAIGALLSIVTVRQGRSLYGRIMLKLMHRAKVKAGKDVYIAGPAGHTPDGALRLPGLLADSHLHEAHDSYGNPFGLIRVVNREVKHYTVVLRVYPEGDELVDQDRVQSMVAHWGAWLTDRGTEDGIAGATVTIETAPDTGLRLQRLLDSQHVEGTSSFSSEVTDAIEREFEGGTPSVKSWVTVTFNGAAFENSTKDRGLEEMSEEIGNALPLIISGLHETGAGTSVRACTAQEIIDDTRIAYDPTAAEDVEDAIAHGGTHLRWEDAGPTYARDQFEYYAHDRAVSKTWQMYEGPRGVFFATSMRRALEPMKDVLRKRVTLVYRPIPAAKASEIVERDINDASFAASQKQRATARAQQRKAYATKAAEEEARGSGLTRFGVLVTVSLRNDEDIRARFARLDKVVPGLFSQAKMRVRPALGNQAVAFQAALPLGVVVPAHMILPDEMRDWT